MPDVHNNETELLERIEALRAVADLLGIADHEMLSEHTLGWIAALLRDDLSDIADRITDGSAVDRPNS